MEFISEELGNILINEDYFNLDNFLVRVMNCNILGSYENRTDIYFVGEDKVVGIIPRFETEFHAEDPLRKINKTGSFEETMTIFPDILVLAL